MSENNEDNGVVLTKREVEVLFAFADGSSYKEVGTKLGIAPSTVNMHNYNAFRKIGARNIREALIYVDKYHKGE